MHEDVTIPIPSVPAPRGQSKRQCPGCSPGLFRRVNRGSLLERTLLTWLGFFPWECVSCRRKRFFRDKGRKAAGTVRP